MTPKELYPIGTQLITRRLSQAALYMEIFGEEKDILFYKSPGYEPDEDEEYKFWMPFSTGDYLEKVCVTVTAENQKWLSPVPMVGDLMFPCEIQGQTGEFAAMVKDPNFGYWHSRKRKIIQRIYPNNQRAPLIAFDDVILPTKGELS